ncbi:MAG: EamA family transporter, partial [Myxococcota bacterium]
MTPNAPTHIWLVLAVAVAAISAAAVLVSGMDGTHPLAIATWRTGLVAAVLAPWVRLPRAKDLAKIGISGVFLAIHFAAWFSSLQLTSVLHSTVLVCLAP